MNNVRPFLAISFAAALLFGCGSSTPSQQPMAGADKHSDKDKKIKAYDKVITKEAVSDSGMFVVHRIVTQNLQGSIRLEAVQPQGVRFVIRFPGQLEQETRA